MTQIGNTPPPSPPVIDQDNFQVPEKALQELNKLIQSGNLTPPPPDGLKPGKADPSAATQRPSLATPEMDPEEAVYAMMALRSQANDEQLKVSENDIESIRQEKMEKHEERMKEIEESYDKMKDAKKSGTFGKVFGWIATAALAIAGAALIATGVGAAAGALMLTAAALMLTQQISAETGNWLMEGLADAIQFVANDVFGGDMSDEDAMMAANITFTVTVAVIGIAGGVASIGAGAAAGASAGASAAANAASVASTSAQIASKVASAANIIGGAAAVGQGATTIYTSVKTKEAEDARAESMEIFAFMQKMQGVMDDEMERIKEILEKMQTGAQVAIDMMSGQAESKGFLIQQQRV